MIDKFMDWTLKVEPQWVGFSVWISGILSIIASGVFILVSILMILEYYNSMWTVLLPIGAFVIYVWVKAIFFQPKRK